MSGAGKWAMGLLILLGIGNLMPVPAGEGEGPPGIAVGLLIALGIAGLISAYGVYKGARWAKPAGITTRVLDILLGLPAFFAGVEAPVVILVSVGIVLSILCIVALVKWEPQSARLATA